MSKVRERDHIISVLDRGYVRLRDHMGSDLSVVNSARVSFDKRSESLNKRDKRLLRYLAEHEHKLPFAHAFLSFEVYAPVIVARQWFKHRVGSVYTEEGDVLEIVKTLPEDQTEAWNESCFPGHQKVRNSNGRLYTVEQLYARSQTRPDKLPYLRSVDRSGELISNKIKSVWKSGRADVYRVRSKLGWEVDTTLNHRFLCDDGVYRELRDIQVGERVMMNGVAAYKDREWLYEKYVSEGRRQDEIASLCGCSVHTIRAWVRKHGIQQNQVVRMHEHNKKYGVFGKGLTADDDPRIAERSRKAGNTRRGMPAYTSGEDHHAWKGRAATASAGRKRWRKIQASECDVCGSTDGVERHHRDGDPHNYASDNLMVLCSRHHHMIHGRSVAMVAHPIEIDSIELVGECDVYDIEMEAEPNLVVNQFVVHNSRRYVTENNQYYLPDTWRAAPTDKKQGSGDPLTLDEVEGLNLDLGDVIWHGDMAYQHALENGVAPEQARLFLPYAALYVRFMWSCSLLRVIEYLKLREASDAQIEIQLYAQAVRELAEPRFPESFRAWFGE